MHQKWCQQLAATAMCSKLGQSRHGHERMSDGLIIINPTITTDSLQVVQGSRLAATHPRQGQRVNVRCLYLAGWPSR